MACDAALNLAGEHFPCDRPETGHAEHGNVLAAAVWSGSTPPPRCGCELVELPTGVEQLHEDGITHRRGLPCIFDDGVQLA